MLLRLKAERLRRQWTQTQLGERLGLTANEIGRIESGHFLPSPGLAVRLAKVLKLQPNELLQPADSDLPLAPDVIERLAEALAVLLVKAIRRDEAARLAEDAKRTTDAA